MIENKEMTKDAREMPASKTRGQAILTLAKMAFKV